MENGTFFATTPTTRDEAFAVAFPQARQIIRGEGYFSGNDSTLFEKWIEETVIPALKRAPATLSSELTACLQPRSMAGVTLGAATLDFFNGLLPHYPENLAQVVAALIIVTAYELRSRNII